jgi:uncharacterized protein YtpQ (UPF0354 family)
MEMRGGADGVRLISAGGNYESSLLLLDDIWSSGQIAVDGAIVVAVPANDALFVTGSNNHIGIRRMREIARKIVDGPYGLTQSLFVYRGGKFELFDGE